MAEVLQEYLISLGFKLDDAALQAFNAKITRAGANIAQLGVVSVAAATQIGIAVEKTAKMYEELYYTSQRTGSSVSALKSYEFGAKQIGLTSEQARSSVEGLASSIRLNPGLAGLLRGMGINPNDSKGAIIELTDRLRKQFGPQGYFVAARQAGMFGIDENTFKQLWDNLDRLKAEQAANIERQKAAGVNVDETAIKFKDLAQSFNTLYDKLGLVKDRIATDYIPAAKYVISATSSVIDVFNSANNATDGWTGRVLALVAALSAAKIALVPLLGLLGFGGAAGVVGRASTAGLGLLGLGAKGLARRLLFNPVTAGALAFGTALGIGDTANTGEKDLKGGVHPDDGRDMSVKFFMDKGWTREQAIGIAANLSSESKFNHTAVGDGGQAYGVAQWHPDRQAAFARWAGKDIRQSSLQEQLAFVHHELTEGGEQRAGRSLRGATSSREAAGIVSSQYERPKNTMDEMTKRGALADKWDSTVLKSDSAGANITISPTTTTTISGVSDPKKAAALVGEENSRQLGNITRWGRGVVDNGAVSK